MDNVIKNDQTMLVASGLSLVESVDRAADAIGTYFTKNWKLIVGFSLTLPLLHLVSYVFPEALSGTVDLLVELILVDVTGALNNIQLHHLVTTLIIFLASLVFGRDEYSFLCQAASLLTWLMLAAYLATFLWPPLVYLLALLWLYGYCTEPTGQDERDGQEGQEVSPGVIQQDTRIKSVLVSFLGRLGLLGVTGQDEPDSLEREERRASEGGGGGTGGGPTTSTPVRDPVRDLTPDSQRLSRVLNLETNKVLPPSETPKLLHPGVSKLQKQHGIVRPNLSGIVQPGATPVGGNTPKSRVLGRSYVYRLKRRSSIHRFGTDSWTYIRWAIWCCLLLQLWLRPALAHLLPAPIAYYLVKKTANWTGVTRVIYSRVSLVREIVRELLEERHHLFFPPPLLFVLKVSYSVERALLRCLSKYLDAIVTSVMLGSVVLGITVAGIFISFQVYAESVYIVQSVATLTSTLNMTDSYIFNKLNTSLTDSGFDTMENVVEGAFNYGRDWISRTLQQTLADADGSAKTDLELKILELWDRSYQYWLTDHRTAGASQAVQQEFSSSLGELLKQLYNSSNIFTISAMQTFIQNNMGTLTSIMEQVWSLTKGNIGFFFDTVLGIMRVILHSGSGVVNFFFSIFVYLTALFYLLSNSADTYIPMEVISQHSIFQISGVGATIQKAVNSVFLITIKMSTFYLLWTYITHVLFSASIVVLPILASSFIGKDQSREGKLARNYFSLFETLNIKIPPLPSLL